MTTEPPTVLVYRMKTGQIELATILPIHFDGEKIGVRFADGSVQAVRPREVYIGESVSQEQLNELTKGNEDG